MSYTKVQIYNMTLNNLKISSCVTSANISSSTDIIIMALNSFYDVALEQILDSADWNFARVFAPLGISFESTIPKYQYAYPYPSNCVNLRKLIISGTKKEKIGFEISTQYPSMQKVINTNASEDCLMVYTRKITDEKYFPSDFVNALTWYLAFLISGDVGATSEKETCLKVYATMLSNAIASNANEDFDDEEESSGFLDARN